MTTPLSQWVCDSTRVAPSVTKALVNRVGGESCMFSPFSHALANAIESKYAIGTQVSRLLLFSGPTNISLFIMSIAIDTIQRVMFARTTPDFLQKLLERNESKFYATLSVQWIFFVVGILATAFCLVKGLVLGAGLVVFVFTVGFRALELFRVPAPARFSGVSKQVFAQNDCHLATRTLTEPMTARLFAFSAGITQDGQTVKDKAGQVTKSVVRRKWLEDQAADVRMGRGHNLLRNSELCLA